ncbi:heat-inducible transcription repressor HrcA [candidate division KSB1 bacterium]|nr:heat-inducible transcription repressor HrcA [candidate division KSB1 bacterium]
MMALNELTERERLIFLSIVDSFIQTAEPVGSRYLAKKYGFKFSPSTIRNIMTDLEDKGLIGQPHTSAGRVPTTLGYRQYVDSLIGVARLDTSDKRVILNKLARFTRDIDGIVEKASEVLGGVSSLLGVALSPRFNCGKVEKIELVRLTDGTLLFVLRIQAGLVKTMFIEIDEEIPQDLLEATNQILNERLYGLSVAQLQNSLGEIFGDLDSRRRMVIDLIRRNSLRVFNSEPSRDFHLSGARNVIVQPEFQSNERIEMMLELIERKDILVKVLMDRPSEGVSIVIGEENEVELMKSCSLITTTFKYQDAVGTIGVIGPVRMKYDKVIALVKFMADALSHMIAHPQDV